MKKLSNFQKYVFFIIHMHTYCSQQDLLLLFSFLKNAVSFLKIHLSNVQYKYIMQFNFKKYLLPCI